MPASYPVKSENKYTSSSVSPIPKIAIAPDKIKSMQGFPISVTSFPRGEYEQRFVHIGKEIYALTKTANKTYLTSIDDFLKYGFLSQIDDYGMESWKAAAEDAPPYLFDEVEVPKETAASGVGETLAERLIRLPSGDTPVTLYVHDIYVQNFPNNKIGRAFSRIENLRQALLEYYKTEDGQKLISYYKSLGKLPDDISWIEVGFLPKNAIYGVGRTQDGEIFITSAEDASDKINGDAAFFGIAPRYFRHSAFTEEQVHILRHSFDKGYNLIREEMKTKAEAEYHYQRLAKDSDGDPKQHYKKRIYEKLAAIKEWDRATTRQRYSRNSKNQNLESLLEESESESSETSQETVYIRGNVTLTSIKGGKYSEGKSNSKNTKNETTYERKIKKSEYKSMSDAKEFTEKNADKSVNETEFAEADGKYENSSDAEPSAEAA